MVNEEDSIESGALSPENKAAAIAALNELNAKTGSETAAQDDDDPSEQMKNDGADQTSAKPKPKAAAKPAVTEKPLTQDQQLKLRVKQEAQRYRAAAQRDAALEAQKLRAAEQREQAAAQREAEFKAKMEEVEAMKRRAREAPKDFLTEAGTSLDDIVRGELESGKPDARVTQAEREMAKIRKEFQDFQQALADEKKRQLDEAEAQKAAAAHQKLLDDQAKAEETFLKTIQDGDYPELSGLLDEPGYVFSMGYAAHSKFKVEHGREPSFEELAATVEKALAKRREKKEDAEDEKPKPKRKGAVSTGGNAPTTSPDLEDMDDEERVKYATKELRRMRKEQAQAEKEV